MSITTEIKVGALFASANDLRTAIAKSLMESGRGVMSGSGGGKQKKFYCSGRQNTGATLPGCTYEVRATKLRMGDWNISFASLSHDNCSGGSLEGPHVRYTEHGVFRRPPRSVCCGDDAQKAYRDVGGD